MGYNTEIKNRIDKLINACLDSLSNTNYDHEITLNNNQFIISVHENTNTKNEYTLIKRQYETNRITDNDIEQFIKDLNEVLQYHHI